MKLPTLVAVAVVSAVTSFAVCKFVMPTQAFIEETAFDRVMRTNTLRCGYIPYSYVLKIDPNTREMSGVGYDVVEELGRLNHLNIEWAEELTWATVPTALQTGRVDALCSGIWVDTQNAKFMAYTTPLYYNSIGIYGRVDEKRFTSLKQLDEPTVRFVARDSSTPEIVSRQEFPHAKQISMPATTSDGELIEGLLTGKADILIYGDDYLSDYTVKNPGKIKNLFPDEKVRVYPLAFGLPMLDVGLKNLFNSTLLELKGSKFIEKSLKKNAPEGGWFADWSMGK